MPYAACALALPPGSRLIAKKLAESPLTADAKGVFIGFRRLGDQRVFFS
jgi:hypothetical protein